MQNDCEGGVILESCNENVIEILSDTNQCCQLNFWFVLFDNVFSMKKKYFV